MKHCYILLLLLKASILLAQPGILDNSFGVSGVAFSPFISQLSYGQALALQPDGKIVVTGFTVVNAHFKIFVTRYNPDGSFDPTFTTMFTSIGVTMEYARAVAVQNDGKIVVAGQITGSHSNFLLFRLTSTGAYDTTFGNGGVVNTGFAPSNNDEPNAMVIQPDGRILITGWTSASPIDRDVALLRFNTDGTADSTFGVNGKVSTDLNNNFEEGHDIVLQPDGKILVAGFSSSSSTAGDVAVIRYLNDGSPDSTFGNSGATTIDVSADDDAALGMALQPDGKIVVAGYTYTNFTYSDNLVMRFDSNGNPDNTFNGTGIIVSNPSNTNHMATGVVLQPDGKIVITGSAHHLVTSEYMLARFNSSGTMDTTFGSGGYAYNPIAIEDDYLLASVIQPDGKIVVTGYYTDSGIENFIVARYLNDPGLSVEENFYNSDMLLYPQPARDLIHVRLHENAPNQVTANIYSVTSSLLQTFSAGREFTIETAHLPAGIYFLQIADSENRMVAGKSFVVE